MSRRERLREQTLQEIKAIARQQMDESGTASISLNAIARRMEITTPALYRYFSNRDELVTALIVDAFSDLADTLEQVAELPAPSQARRLFNVLLAYRDWALTHPVDFELIYGNPLPNYHAPEEKTVPAARRGFEVILRILLDCYQDGELTPPAEYHQLPAGLSIGLSPDDPNFNPSSLPDVILHLGVVGWYHIHGMIMLELFHHIQPMVNDPGIFYQRELELMLRSLGIEHLDSS